MMDNSIEVTIIFVNVCPANRAIDVVSTYEQIKQIRTRVRDLSFLGPIYSTAFRKDGPACSRQLLCVCKASILGTISQNFSALASNRTKVTTGAVLNCISTAFHAVL